jgi:ubiquinone/menaquinone biosynthesis C-methylase UbiE
MHRRRNAARPPMELGKYRCPQCHGARWTVDAATWRCDACGRVYPCVRAVPKLYLEEKLAPQDRDLRDHFYDGLVGTYYRYLMPFLSLPVRPFRLTYVDWTVFVIIGAILLALLVYLGNLLFVRQLSSLTITDVMLLLASIGIAAFFKRHPYLFYLFVLAIPVRISVLLSDFKPVESFAQVHARTIEKLKDGQCKLQVLDVSTGNCSSLYKHGWMELNAEFTGVDLSETMLMQGLQFMARKQVSVEFVLAPATSLPLRSGTFDVVLNYGAINGVSDPRLALQEMARVTKTGGLLLFLDEQLYDGASWFERMYFGKVLSAHNVIHSCPVDLLPAGLTQTEVHQVYQFYYICTAIKT